uniref:E3 ubiquitin-protein ligase RNF182 n=1 Tax=Podarcis muralis TaxID=64176 RepID=A0A670KAP9_PODMU
MALLLPAIDLQPEARMVECGICYEAYKEASSGQVPKLLWCCHSLCLACLRKLVCQNTAFSFVVCPFCRMVTLVPEAGLQALRNDEALLREIAPQREWKLEDREELGDSKDSPGALDLPLRDKVRQPLRASGSTEAADSTFKECISHCCCCCCGESNSCGSLLPALWGLLRSAPSQRDSESVPFLPMMAFESHFNSWVRLL